MIDGYSKVVLTVIAMAVSGICVQGFIRGASAQSGSCGSSYVPCHVVTGTQDLTVRVMNWPLTGPPRRPAQPPAQP
jgi:hypothetical protein